MSRVGPHGGARVAAGLAVAILAVTGCSGASGDAGTPTSGRPSRSVASAPPSSADDSTRTAAGPAADVPDAKALAAGRSTPVEDPYYADTSNPEVDVLHYFLDLAYDGDVLTGQATVTFRATRATDRIRLDLSQALHVSSVSLDGADADYAQRHEGLVTQTPGLRPGVSHTFLIDYAGTPESTPAPSKRSDMTEGLGWNTDTDGAVYTFQEPYGAFTWYPSNDHPSDEALFDARITTVTPAVGVFNGALESKRVDGDSTTTRWHVDEPMATYLTTLAIGPYREYHAATSSGITLAYWLMKRDKHLLPQLRSEGATAFDWLVAHAGRYPFSTLGLVVVGGNSAMETQTMMTLSRGVFDRPDAVIEHEMAHQWFGDSVSPTDWQGLWLNEGWAMYLQQWYEADTHRYRYAGGIRHWRRYDNASRADAGPPGRYHPDSFGDLNVYLGPAMMLDEIRRRIGDARFDALVKAWARQHENQNVDRADFTRWVNGYTGRNFSPLINRWLDSPTTPR